MSRPVPALLMAATETLRHLGPRRFSLTAVAEAAEVSRARAGDLLGRLGVAGRLYHSEKSSQRAIAKQLGPYG